VNTDKLKELDLNYTGVKFKDMPPELKSKRSSKIKKPKKKIDDNKTIEEVEICYESNRPLVPFLAMLEPQTGTNTGMNSPNTPINGGLPSPTSSDSDLFSAGALKF
jgi:hypothetical protein